jgi:NAD+ kinase
MEPQLPSRIGIITKPGEPRAREVAASIAQWAVEHATHVLINDRVDDVPPGAISASEAQIAEQCDLLVVLGGDGTMLATSRLLQGRGTPVLGVNLGVLGYLTEFHVDEAIIALESVRSNDYQIDSRMMLDWRVLRGDREIEASSALNEVAVNKSALARIIEIDFSVGSTYVTTYRADGLIIATPTGSTAYNLSAGGPIIVPGARAISIAPICPHTLTNRPLVLPDDAEIRLRLNTVDQEVMLTSDGHTGVPLESGCRIEIKKSAKTFNTVTAKDRDYFQILRNKLKWSGR